MSRYFIHNGTEKEGPFDIDALRAKAIKSTTPVWCEGMSDWTEAGRVDELKSLFPTPPPFTGATGPKQPTPETNSAAAKAAANAKTDRRIGRVLQLIGLIGLIGIVSALGLAWFSSSSSGRGSSYAEKVMTVEEIEQADPARFLEASGTWNGNFWGDRLKIHGTVTSKATVAKFKDVRIRVRYLSSTGTVLGADDYILYEFVPAHSTVKFEWKINRPANCEKLGWDVISATPVLN